MRYVPSAPALARRFDLLLWRIFGQGARLKAKRPALGRTGLLGGLLTVLGVSLPK